jgi:MFS family permease
MLFMPLLLYFLAIYITYPLAAQIVTEIICDDKNSINDDDCSSSSVSGEASLVLLYISCACNVPAFFLTGFYGSLADKYGRRIVMFVSLVGFLIYCSGLFIVAVLKPSFYIWLLAICSFCNGLTGSFATFLLGNFSYAADITAMFPGDRSRVYSVLEAGILVAQVFAPIGLVLSLRFRLFICFNRQYY